MARIAAVDIGTVSVRLAIADVMGGEVTEIFREANICDLGEGVAQTGRISHAAIARVASCVDAYLTTARTMEATHVCCTLTSAAREANNAVQLLSELSIRNLIPQVIPGDVEARLAFAGVVASFPGEHLLVVDSGGGSTEFAVGPDAGGILPEWVRSVPIGCRRLTERFLVEDPPTPASIELAYESCKLEFSAPAMHVGFGERPERLVMCGGTATSIAAMLQELEPYDPAKIHHCEVRLEDVSGLLDQLVRMGLSRRKRMKGLQEQRAHVIVGGVIAIKCALEVLGYESFTVSESDLLFGMLEAAAARLEENESPLGWAPELAELA